MDRDFEYAQSDRFEGLFSERTNWPSPTSIIIAFTPGVKPTLSDGKRQDHLAKEKAKAEKLAKAKEEAQQKREAQTHHRR